MATFKRCSNCHQLFTGKECPVCRAKMAAAYQKRRLCMNESTKRYHSRAPDRFLDEDNLIPVGHASHEEIHAWYNNGRRKEALARIQKGKEVYEERFEHEYRRRSETSAHPP